MYFLILAAGFLGGVIRGLVGFLKHQFSYKNVPFNIYYFFGMCFISGIIGVTVVSSLKEIGFTFHESFTPALGVIIGYAGGDFIENIYKIIIKKSSFSKFPQKQK